MKDTVLLYNFSGERLSKIRRALLPLKFRVKVVQPSEYTQPLGYLAGIKGYSSVSEETDNAGFQDEMMLISASDNRRIEALIQALYKNGVGKIDLKAALTPANVDWNSNQLYAAVKSDHDEMNRKNS